MGFGAAVFSIFGLVKMEGIDKSFKEIDRLDKKASEFTKSLNKFAKQVNQAGLALSRSLSVPLAGVGTAIGALALKTGNYASNLSSLNQATGLSTDTLQEFAHVATTAGGSSEALFSTITALTGKLPELAAGTGDTSKALSELGVRVTNADGSYRNMNELFPQIIEKLQGVTDQTQRNTLAYDIFGKKTKEVSAFLGMSATEMAALRQEAHNMGLVMDGDALKKADNFRIGVENLKAQFVAIGHEIATGFIPLLTEQLVPVIKNMVLPALQWMVNGLKATADGFSGIPPWIQKVVLALGGLLAAVGPLLLGFGAFMKAGTNLAVAWSKFLVVAGKLGTVVVHVAVAIKGAFAAIGIGAGVAVAAIAGVIATIGLLIAAHYKLKQAQKLEEETKGINDNVDALRRKIEAAKEAFKHEEALKGTAEENAEYLELTRKRYEDSVIALKEYNMQLQKKRSLTAEEIEATRLALRGEKDKAGAIAKTEYQMAQEAKDAEEAAKKRGELAKKAAEDENRRKEALADLVKANRDAIDEMILDDDRLLDKQEVAELDKAKALKAGETELDAIRDKFSIIRAKRAEEATEKEIEQAKEELKAKVDFDNDWSKKLLQQSGDRLRILAAERANELALVEETGADAAKIEEYYANEEKRIREEANAGWDDKLAGQAAERRQRAAEASKDAIAILDNELSEKLAALRNESARELAEAEKSGADIARVKAYYAAEENRITAEGAEKRKAIRAQEAKAFADGMVGAVNKIGSLLSMASSNEGKRLDGEHKRRKEAIEASISDEKARAAAIAELDTEMDARKLGIQKEEAKREKALGIFNAIINTAQAVVSALKAGPIAGPILAGIIGALGAAEIGVIASTPEPFEAGALIQGGRGGVTGLVGEGKQDELIMPMETGVEKLAAALADRGGVAASGDTYNYHVSVNVGNMIADDRGIKQLGRKIREVIIAEDRRTGVTA